MKISRSAHHSIRALVHLAKRDGNTTVHSIAKEENMPQEYLVKLLADLAKNRTTFSLKGPQGGHRLAKPAKEITLLEILESADGPIVGEVPLDNNTPITRKLQGLCADIAQETRKRLVKVKLSDLAK